jgi:hypothetical protein
MPRHPRPRRQFIQPPHRLRGQLDGNGPSLSFGSHESEVNFRQLRPACKHAEKSRAASFLILKTYHVP